MARTTLALGIVLTVAGFVGVGVSGSYATGRFVWKLVGLAGFALLLAAYIRRTYPAD